MPGGRLKTVIDQTIRLSFHAFWRVSRGQTLAVRVILFKYNGHVLLVRRKTHGEWGLPSATVLPGETARTTAERALSAAGVAAAQGTWALRALYRVAEAKGAGHIVLFSAKTDAEPPSPSGVSEPATAYFAPAALPEGTGAAVQARIAEILDGAAPSETW